MRMKTTKIINSCAEFFPKIGIGLNKPIDTLLLDNSIDDSLNQKYNNLFNDYDDTENLYKSPVSDNGDKSQNFFISPNKLLDFNNDDSFSEKRTIKFNINFCWQISEIEENKEIFFRNLEKFNLKFKDESFSLKEQRT